MTPHAATPAPDAEARGQASAPGADLPVISRALPWLLAGGGAVGLAAAGALLVEKLNVLRDADYQPTCSINPVISCGTVMNSPQAEVFGVPNPLIGIACFAVVTTVGMALLAGARFQRWFWLGLQAGVVFGAGFVHWLIFQSLYRISALCPYCMVVWAVTVPIFWYVTLHNLRTGHLPVGGRGRRPLDVLARNHTVVLTVWALAVVAAIGQAFWTYWQTLL
ncbi:vitamin K epoxide reductase family protein [Marinitenerispora sediminis]|uniref:Vitamin K epoxide reductase n=1 Tax=Marinitenerispora sediminis TaxID=1931232 RepID=A0A368T273_9ACTN|nr:vitamin K epoxide reductase family protein [Marinitenerispora sediminis]RCV49030.1 vitamin K epoxide reductase [Marinitenerispora sediminis]RCV51793.1 vitamin K epoxide reductase [Marinitenerispora sediminis]RCV55411.1 vitamin K epoxide reductase [Marinitenerispora sediminis]